MKRWAACVVLAVGVVGFDGQASAHEGGHQGGCEDFGHVNREIGHDPAAFGFPDARNLGNIVSSFAHIDDGQPGVGDVVENVDHLACGGD
jgi:hypothetical protein